MATPLLPSARPVRRAPSITRLFFATFFVVTLAGLTITLTSWIDARQTQRDALAVLETLDQLHAINASPTLEAQRNGVRDIVLDLSDSAQQAALGTTIITAALLIALGIGLVYSRRRLAEPFGTIVAALERVATGEYDLHLREDGAEFGTIARGVNRMSATLAWRERMQEYTARLLAALNAAPREGAGLTPALDVLGEATGSSALVLYQPDYQANHWEATAARGVQGTPVSRITVREIVGDGSG
ncbi:MAG TPA: HAMP domain-containing protein, partial [Gemmatimonadales bacterium]